MHVAPTLPRGARPRRLHSGERVPERSQALGGRRGYRGAYRARGALSIALARVTLT